MADTTTPQPKSTGQTVADATAAAAGLALGRYFANQGANANIPPQLSQLMDIGVARANAQNPLFGAVNSGVYQMLPTFARQGAGAFTPNVQAAGYGSPSGSGPGTGAAVALASLPAVLGILKKLYPAAFGGVPGAGGVANLGPEGPGGTPDFPGVGPLAAGSGSGSGPGSNAYNTIANLNASGIGGMFYGGPSGGGGVGYAGDQSGGIPDKIRGPKAF